MPKAIDVVELTKKLLTFNTINPPGNEGGCARFLGELLRDSGFSLTYHELAEGRTSIIARRGHHLDGLNGSQRAKPICFTGHIDTVPLGAANWSVDPFTGEVVDGKLYGRGSTDMKSGVAAMVAAAISSADELERGPGLMLVLTAGEETGCAGANQLVQLEGVLGTAGAIVVGEPTSNYPRIGHKGVLWLLAETRGVTAHGSTPEYGVNAVVRGAKIVTKLENFGFIHAPHPVLGSPTVNVGRMQGGMNINSVPDRAEIALDVRSIPGTNHDEIVEWLRSHLAPELDELTTIVNLAPVWTESSDPWVQDIFGLVEPYLGEYPVPKGVSYFSDASVLKAALGGPPTLILGPGEARMAHQTDEYCFVHLIEQAVNIYRDILCHWQSDRRSLDAA